ncbi:uncharacterized protein LOC133712737 [Rosa rugosa]|uniref:uncharacterized protein LOC133712737 n=1 Tax=Rosa rugosa TaxID=74645 RepID=UPI002B40F300|nr:uncharacterized protein LOC133712737 [Rosa rugosa]
MAKEYTHLEFRCDLLKFGRVMTDELRADITEVKLDLIESTPFRDLFRAFYERQIIDSACDIPELFGLNIEGREINLNQKKRKGDSDFIKRRFPGVKRLSKVILEQLIKDVSKLRGLENECDFVSMVKSQNAWHF